MNDSIYIAATGMTMQQKSLDTIANNLANLNTPAFKKGQVNFEELVYRAIRQVSDGGDAASSRSLWHGNGVAISSLTQSFMAGALKKTAVPLDVAIQGNGFFEVTEDDGSRAYSRGGSLLVNKDGFLATSNGYLLKPNIHVGLDPKSVTIGTDGRVTVQGSDRGVPTEVGRLELAHFSDTSGLLAHGGNLYTPTERSGDAIYGKPGDDGVGIVVQGSLEASNVNLTDEMVNLMVVQRAYESNVKVIQASDEMLSMSNNLRK